MIRYLRMQWDGGERGGIHTCTQTHTRTRTHTHTHVYTQAQKVDGTGQLQLELEGAGRDVCAKGNNGNCDDDDIGEKIGA